MVCEISVQGVEEDYRMDFTPFAVFEAGAFQACEKGKNKVDVLSENA